MTEPFTIVTPTGDRPEAFALCWKYVLEQTLLPAQWLIVDDGKISRQYIPDNAPSWVQYIRREPQQGDPQHTLPVQLATALRRVTTDRVLVLEDDDWYRRDYCERMMEMFDSHPKALLVGQGQAVYYHVPFRKCFQLSNADRASLCQTGFRSTLIPQVLKACQDMSDPFVDLRLWRSPVEKFLLLNQAPLCVGIKGLPGRQNTRTIGHRATHPGFKPDPGGLRLKSLIGGDTQLYEKFQDPSPIYPSGEKIEPKRC